MEKYDRELASRVWQRVYPQNPPQEPDDHALLRRFLTEEAQAAQCYASLAKTLTGSARTLGTLAEASRRNVLHLKGLCFLLTGSRPAAPKLPVREENPEAALRRCCGECIRWAKACQEHSGDGEYGCIWEELAKKKREQSFQILQILGSLP